MAASTRSTFQSLFGNYRRLQFFSNRSQYSSLHLQLDIKPEKYHTPDAKMSKKSSKKMQQKTNSQRTQALSGSRLNDVGDSLESAIAVDMAFARKCMFYENCPTRRFLEETCFREDIELNNLDLFSLNNKVHGLLQFSTDRENVKFKQLRARFKKKKSLKFKHRNDGSIIDLSPKSLISECLRAELRKCGNISEQISTLHSLLKLSQGERNLRFFICREIESAIRQLLPHLDFMIVPFGSSVNGLGMRLGDLDMCIYLGPALEGNEIKRKILQKMARGLKYDRAFDGYQVTEEVYFAKTPIVIFRHLATGTSCDLSVGQFNEKSGHDTAKLVHALGLLDSRFKELMLMLKVWIKINQLSGRPPKPNTFALTMLMVFYFQTIDKPILPPLKMVFEHIETDGSIQSLRQKFKSTRNTPENEDNLETLFMGFLQYYRDFDFSQVICLLHGQVKQRALSKDFNYRILMRNPMDNSRNMFVKVRQDYLDYLQHCMDKSYQSLLQSRDRCSSDWGILALLNVKEENT